MTKSVRNPSSNNVSQGGIYIPTNETTYITYYFFSDFYARDVGGPDCVTERDEVCLKNVFKGEFNSYYTGTLTDSETNKNNLMKSICPTFDLFYYNIEEEYKKSENCEEPCLENTIVANEYINDMRQSCNSILAHRDYFIINEKDDSIISSDACVVSCLDLFELVNGLKEKYGISVDIEGSCGFSGKLIQFIANIVKWVKYIIPVIVIVLGILDFIKAISADKDDEIKKAQGRFVKRLIAAALIFIIPFIIEFVLGKMGFDSNGCGIIDL